MQNAMQLTAEDRWVNTTRQEQIKTWSNHGLIHWLWTTFMGEFWNTEQNMGLEMRTGIHCSSNISQPYSENVWLWVLANWIFLSEDFLVPKKKILDLGFGTSLCHEVDSPPSPVPARECDSHFHLLISYSYWGYIFPVHFKWTWKNMPNENNMTLWHLQKNPWNKDLNTLMWLTSR